MLYKMHQFLCKRFSITRFQIQKCYSVDNLQCLKFLCTITSSFSTSRTNEKASFTLNDLIESCPLSRKILNRTKSSKTPNSVMKFLQSSGFSQTHVKAIVSEHPHILFSDPQKTLKPKISFFRSIGMSEFDVANNFSKCPALFMRSLKNCYIPAFNSIRTLLGEKHAVGIIKNRPFILLYNVANRLAPNLSTLKDNGVPEFQILKLINRQGIVKVLGFTKPDRFNKVLSAVLGLGFSPQTSAFEHAIIVMASWEVKLRIFGSLGFSEKEILSIFRKQPIIMEISDKCLKEKVEFYVKRFQWSPSQLSVRPNILMYSLERRIAPRCSVLQVLVSRKRIERNIKLLCLLVRTERDFFNSFVSKYMDEIPEVLDAYQGKLEFDEYNFDSGKD